MTELRTRMIEDMQLAGHSQGTQEAYIRAVRQLAGHFRVPPDQLTERQLRDYLMHLREVRQVAKGTFRPTSSASSSSSSTRWAMTGPC